MSACEHKPTHPQYPVFATRGFCQYCRIKVIYDGKQWIEDLPSTQPTNQP